ncbi:MAG TPA: sterol desaturase family protein [Xanthomonadales bacterium]|nr:sterol desaturase family protein [Xanthomonadales bacterium]
MNIRPVFLAGMAWTSLFLGFMSLLAVIAFHFPEYLTTPRLREVYQESQVRALLYAGMVLCGLLALPALLFSRLKLHALAALACLLLAWLAGGAEVPLESGIQQPRFYLSLDWVLLDLVLMATLFINIELFFRLKPQQGILRHGWKVDLAHYVANHLFNGVIVVALFVPANSLEKYLGLESLQATIASLPLWLQVVMLMLVTDFAQYWVHRAFHHFPLLWRFHRIHHSVQAMDWLAGSRLHIVDVVVTRAISLVPLVLLGFSNAAINIYLPILALQAVFIHSNLRFEMAWLQKIITTPKYHHWHHTRDAGCTDRNFAVSLPLLDVLFGTYYSPKGQWPESYGIKDPQIAETYLAHLLAPFRQSDYQPGEVNDSIPEKSP